MVRRAGVITPLDYLVGRRDLRLRGLSRLIDRSLGNSGQLPLWIQPIVFTCPGAPSSPALSSVPFRGQFAAGQVADQSALGQLFTNTASIALTTNATTVGQGFSGDQMTTNPLNTPVTSTVPSRLFVGDARPIQVMFREGLLYEARTARIYDSLAGPLGTSTVLYDLIRTCATGAPNPTCGYSVNGLASTLGGGMPPPFLSWRASGRMVRT